LQIFKNIWNVKTFSVSLLISVRGMEWIWSVRNYDGLYFCPPMEKNSKYIFGELRKWLFCIFFLYLLCVDCICQKLKHHFPTFDGKNDLIIWKSIIFLQKSHMSQQTSASFCGDGAQMWCRTPKGGTLRRSRNWAIELWSQKVEWKSSGGEFEILW